MWYIVLPIAAIVAFFIIRLFTMKNREKVSVAYAGSANGLPAVEEVEIERNKPIYTENGEIVNLSKYRKFLIKGNSLERVGLKSGDYVFTRECQPEEVVNKFVVFKYDLKRQAEQYPDRKIESDSHKARKAIKIIATNLSESEFYNAIKMLIDNDSEIKEKDSFKSAIWEKYRFASEFYSEQKILIMSLTYKDGCDKMYSFHSPDFLVGVVEYRTK